MFMGGRVNCTALKILKRNYLYSLISCDYVVYPTVGLFLNLRIPLC